MGSLFYAINFGFSSVSTTSMPCSGKAYAADFCGTATLSGASWELVKFLISHLSAAAKENRRWLRTRLDG
jgi:hypothetical protein